MGQHEEVDGFLIRCSLSISPAYGAIDLLKPERYQATIHTWTYPIISRTAKGVWIDDMGKKRFVLNNAKKRFAYPTYELALNSLLIRLRHELWYRQLRVEAIKKVLAAGRIELCRQLVKCDTPQIIFEAPNG